MSVPYEALLLDIGNSRIKYALYSKEIPLSVNWAKDADELVSVMGRINKVLIAAVGQSRLVEQVEALAKGKAKQCLRLESSEQAFGVMNAYDDPRKLGIDRWLAMLAGRQITKNNFAVLDFGTAATCDFVDASGRHLGGWIAPGLTLMRRSLLQNTEKVSGRASDWAEEIVGKNTLDAVDAGCQAQGVGLLLQAEAYLRQNFSSYDILLCGGDHQRIAKKTNLTVKSYPELVFLGMTLFA